MYNWHDIYQASQDRHEEIRLQIQRNRLSRNKALPSQAAPPRAFYSPFAARLGRWMVAWGSRLQARHGTLEFREG